MSGCIALGTAPYCTHSGSTIFYSNIEPGVCPCTKQAHYACVNCCFGSSSCCCFCCLQAEPVAEAKLKAAAGLASLDSRRYKAAARAFVSVSAELGTNYSDVS